MSAYVRLKWLHEQMSNNKYPTIKKLCNVFEISYRQGQRDIEYMRDFLGAPIEYSTNVKGYFYTGNFSMPTLYLSNDEAHLIKKLSDYYSSLQDDGFDDYKIYGKIFSRISSNHKSNTNNIVSFQVPYIAKVKIKENRYTYRLLDKYFRSKNEDVYIYEFHNVELFIGLLLSCVSDFEIIFPVWLKERVLKISRKCIKNNE